jgi:hypothetical protein
MEPLNDLEVALQQAQAGQLDMPQLLGALLKAQVAVPSATEVMHDGSGLVPLLFPRNGAQMLACFTDTGRIGIYSALAPYCLVVKGHELLRTLPPGCGLVLNPGVATGYDVPPQDLAAIAEQSRLPLE